MFSRLIIKDYDALVNYLRELNLIYFFSRQQVKHIAAFIIGMMLDGFNGKIADVSKLAAYRDSSCVSRFLSSEYWDDAILQRELKNYAVAKIWTEAKETKQPICVIIDDTICEKTRPSSKAKHPIAGCGDHFSHLEQKNVYGQQFVTVLLQCGELALPYSTTLYDKKGSSKIKIAVDEILSLPKPPPKVKAYVLADSWYSCKAVLKACDQSGFKYIGALRTNRAIYPYKGSPKVSIQAKVFAQTLNISDVDLVTVNGVTYCTYVYVGKINGYSRVKIVFSCPKDVFIASRDWPSSKVPWKMFITTDLDLTTSEIFGHYSMRWPIEVFFREANRRLGMKRCQARSLSAVKRYQYLLMLAYAFCGLADGFVRQDGEVLTIGKARTLHQEIIGRSRLAYAYECGQKNTGLDQLFIEAKLA